MNYTTLSLFAALALASVPGHAEVYVGIGYGAPAPYIAAPSSSYYYAPPVPYGPPPVQYLPRPVYAPPLIVAPPPEAVPDWRWREDGRRWNRWQRHNHRGWRENDDD
jgi:hypothetical protein|nr:hypothetical protein [Comamonas sp.]